MKKATLTVFVLALALVLAGPANAELVDFDSIIAADTERAIPTGYAGFTWDSLFAVMSDSYDYNPTNHNTVTFPSSPNAAFNGTGVVQVYASKSTPFNLVGAYFSYFAVNDGFSPYSSAGITVTGYNSGRLVGAVHVSLTNNFVYQSLGLANIDTVTFTTDEGVDKHWWLMDNMEYSAVPLPGTVWLLGSGFLGLAGWRRFRKI